MIRFFILFILSLSFLYANPYKQLPLEEKLTLLTNHFLNKELKQQLPQAPQKEQMKDHGYSFEPRKYERNYNYVQRVKAIKESLAQEQEKIDQKYAADISKYNKKIRIIEKRYENKTELLPLLQNAFNKALKVIYGKPFIKKELSSILLDAQSIYGIGEFIPKKVIFKDQSSQKNFDFQKCEVKINFEYIDDIVIYKNIECQIEEELIIGRFLPEDNLQIKLNIKINDDIFQPLKIEDNNR